MSGEGVIVTLIVGALTAWLAGRVDQGSGFGLRADICIGIGGAAIACASLLLAGVRLVENRSATAGAAMIGASLLLCTFGIYHRSFEGRRRGGDRPVSGVGRSERRQNDMERRPE